ncbi:MAG TPA: tetratricopeptide repeat protein [Vicinamibacterales bacterium]|nr:tetratricopeptide repeat protein [Vicinamibacterales bacterium]
MIRTGFACLCAIAIFASAAAAQVQERYLVMPFENPAREARVYWLSEASAVLLADDLNALGRRAYTREERLEAFEQLQVPPVASLSRATVIRLGQLVGATHVVIGSFALTGDQMTIRAQNVRLDTGRMETEIVESGLLENLFEMFDRVSRRVTGSATPVVTPLARPRLPVFEQYIKGLIASATPTKISYLESAIKLDPGFDRARLALWAVHHDEGNGQAALVAATAVPETSPIYPRARFAAASSLIQLKRVDDAFAMLRTLAERVPSAPLMNNIGVIQMRRPVTPQTGRATYYFNQALKIDQDDPDYYFNLGYAYWAEKDPQAAIFWLREAVRRNPTDGEAHAVLAAALQATGAAAEAVRERELATQLSSTYAAWAKAPTGGEPIPRGLERLKPSLDISTVRRIDSAIATGQREQKELAAFHLDRGRRLFEQGSHTDAITELRRALYLSPYEAEAHLLLGRIYLRTGQTPAAIDAFKIALWSRESIAGHIELSHAYVQNKDVASARATLQRALVLDPTSGEVKSLLGKLGP